MNDVKVGNSMANVTTVWRYMSLDKLINMLETESIYFSPLSMYIMSDPYEGFPPSVTIRLFASVISKRNSEMGSEINSYIESFHNNPYLQQTMRETIRHVKSDLAPFSSIFKKVIKSTIVNCWHSNKNESEAMWRIYSENGNGIAIKSNVASIVSALKNTDDESKINFGLVNYIDFNDENLTSTDCAIDGELFPPLLKRTSFNHENEARLYITPDINLENPLEQKIEAKLIKIDINTLIDAIHISPSASELYRSSVRTICKKYGIDEQKIVDSNLLKGADDLLKLLMDDSGI